jgi:hypothetical protein
MIIRKRLMTAIAAVSVTALSWALPGTALSCTGQAHNAAPAGSSAGNPHGLTSPGHLKQQSGEQGDAQGRHDGNSTGPSGRSGLHGKSHKCTPHRVAYIASGTLQEANLTKNANGTYSGEIAVVVKRGNHHAKLDKATTQKYTLTNARLVLAISDTNNDGSVGLDDLRTGEKGDRVKLIGRVTTLAKHCDHSKFTAQRVIRQVVLHDPQS